MDLDFWKGKKVFLTGHTGFKGSWLSIWLNHLGATVYGYSLPAPTEPSLFEAAKVSERVQGEFSDIRDFQKLKTSLIQFAPEIVIHMAAQPLVRDSYDNPIETYETNVMGTLNVLQACRSVLSLRSLVIVTTDKCYENLEHDIGYLETDRLGGYDPYSSSKACAEIVTTAMKRSFFSGSQCAIASVRAGNVIGGGDWAKDRLVPDFMRSFSSNVTVQVRNPEATRPWQHVLEPLCGYLIVAQKMYTEGEAYAGAWNFGPPEKEARTVRSIATRLTELWGGTAKWVDQNDGTHPHEARYLKLNIEKAVGKLSWKPRLNFDETLELTCAWYKNFYKDRTSAYATTLDQIKKFEQKVKNIS